MKEIEVACSKWRNGQGWEYRNAIIDRKKIPESDIRNAKEILHEVKLSVEPNLTEDDPENGIDYQWAVNIIDENGNVIDTASSWETEF